MRFNFKLCLVANRRLVFVLIFPKNCACAHIWQANKNKLKEKHAESSEQLVTEFPPVYTPVSYLWILRKYGRQLRSIRMYKSYTFSETISRAKNNKMGHC